MSEPCFEHANYIYWNPSEEGSFFLPPTPEAVQTLKEAKRDEREQLDAIRHDESHINTARIDGFLSKYGLGLKPFVVVDDSGYQEIAAILSGHTKEGLGGEYITDLDFTYTIAHDASEPHSAERDEENIIHELTHANHATKDIVYFNSDRADAVNGLASCVFRSGFHINLPEDALGDYFEEGCASLMAHKYVLEALGHESGFLDRTAPQIIAGAGQKNYLLPGSYLFRRPDNAFPGWAVGAHAGYGMQLLIHKDPDIFPAMLHARHQVDGLREFAHRVERLDSGLYSALREQPYKEPYFVAATNHIIERLYDGNHRVAIAAAREVELEPLLAA